MTCNEHKNEENTDLLTSTSKNKKNYSSGSVFCYSIKQIQINSNLFSFELNMLQFIDCCLELT